MGCGVLHGLTCLPTHVRSTGFGGLWGSNRAAALHKLSLHRKNSQGQMGGTNELVIQQHGFFGGHRGNKGDLVLSMLKGGNSRNRSEQTNGEIKTDSLGGNQDFSSANGRILSLQAQADADAAHKGYLEIRRFRVLGKNWVRVNCILTHAGTFHIFQHVPPSHHAIDLGDFHCIDNNAKKMQVFSMTPIIESPQDKHSGANHFIFRCPAPDSKKTKEDWMVAVRTVKHQIQTAKLQSPSPKMERRHSLPKDFGSSQHLPVLEELEDEDSVDENETASGPTEDATMVQDLKTL